LRQGEIDQLFLDLIGRELGAHGLDGPDLGLDGRIQVQPIAAVGTRSRPAETDGRRGGTLAVVALHGSRSRCREGPGTSQHPATARFPASRCSAPTAAAPDGASGVE
jgi:hypothetical protein